VVARASGWLLVVMAAVTCFDVLARKMGLPVPLTKLQELEWHFHAAIFSLWMGYGYTTNAHPRVDSFTEPLTLRHRAWIELAGCLRLALPYMALVPPTTARCRPLGAGARRSAGRIFQQEWPDLQPIAR
jgi:TRAP-type mannitol/chloroaromatic compound transport system permease small subunit